MERAYALSTVDVDVTNCHGYIHPSAMSELGSIGVGKKKGQLDKKKSRLRKLAAGAAAVAGVAVVAKRRAATKAGFFARIAKDDPVSRTKNKIERIVATSLTMDDVSEMLSIPQTVLLRRIRSRSIYALRDNDRWIFPAFQFQGNRPVREIGRVLRELDRSLHVVAVFNWLTMPDCDLVLNDGPVSPVEWLEARGDVGKVAALARELGSGL